jgi:alkaline phosphatase D
MMMAFKLTNSVMPLYKSLRPNTIQAREETYEGLLISLDQWDGYPEERKQLLTFIQDYNIQNVVVLTGDIHNCYAGVLRPDFTHGSSLAVAVEIVGGSVTSDGIAEHTDNKDHSDFIYRVLKHPNPHLEYLDAYHHVYTRVEVSPDATVATYVAVDTVRSEGFEFFDLMRLTVPEGTPELLVEAPSLQKRRPGGRSRR